MSDLLFGVTWPLVQDGLMAATRKNQPTKQRVGVIKTRQMLPEEFSRRQRIQQVSEFSHVSVETLLHFFLKFTAKPVAQRGSETAFLAPANFRRNPGRESIPQDCLAHARSKVILDGQARGKMHQVRIQERRAALQGSAHARA